MPTQITQIDDAERHITIFRVEGDLLRDDVDLIRRIVECHKEASGNCVTVDLADLDFLDSDSASDLMRLEREGLFEIVGTEIFLQTIVNAAEKTGTAN